MLMLLFIHGCALETMKVAMLEGRKVADFPDLAQYFPSYTMQWQRISPLQWKQTHIYHLPAFTVATYHHFPVQWKQIHPPCSAIFGRSGLGVELGVENQSCFRKECTEFDVAVTQVGLATQYNRKPNTMPLTIQSQGCTRCLGFPMTHCSSKTNVWWWYSSESMYNDDSGAAVPDGGQKARPDMSSHHQLDWWSALESHVGLQ